MTSKSIAFSYKTNDSTGKKEWFWNANKQTQDKDAVDIQTDTTYGVEFDNETLQSGAPPLAIVKSTGSGAATITLTVNEQDYTRTGRLVTARNIDTTKVYAIQGHEDVHVNGVWTLVPDPSDTSVYTFGPIPPATQAAPFISSVTFDASHVMTISGTGLYGKSVKWDTEKNTLTTESATNPIISFENAPATVDAQKNWTMKVHLTTALDSPTNIYVSYVDPNDASASGPSAVYTASPTELVISSATFESRYHGPSDKELTAMVISGTGLSGSSVSVHWDKERNSLSATSLPDSIVEVPASQPVDAGSWTMTVFLTAGLSQKTTIFVNYDEAGTGNPASFEVDPPAGGGGGSSATPTISSASVWENIPADETQNTEYILVIQGTGTAGSKVLWDDTQNTLTTTSVPAIKAVPNVSVVDEVGDWRMTAFLENNLSEATTVFVKNEAGASASISASPYESSGSGGGGDGGSGSTETFTITSAVYSSENGEHKIRIKGTHTASGTIRWDTYNNTLSSSNQPEIYVTSSGTTWTMDVELNDPADSGEVTLIKVNDDGVSETKSKAVEFGSGGSGGTDTGGSGGSTSFITTAYVDDSQGYSQLVIEGPDDGSYDNPYTISWDTSNNTITTTSTPFIYFTPSDITLDGLSSTWSMTLDLSEALTDANTTVHLIKTSSSGETTNASKVVDLTPPSTTGGSGGSTSFITTAGYYTDYSQGYEQHKLVIEGTDDASQDTISWDSVNNTLTDTSTPIYIENDSYYPYPPQGITLYGYSSTWSMTLVLSEALTDANTTVRLIKTSFSGETTNASKVVDLNYTPPSGF